MRQYLVLLIVALQVAVMASVVVKREALLATDNTVVLRTAPVDPRDPFRGDFVILDYEANSVASSLADPLIVNDDRDAFKRVYASLKADASGVSTVTKLSLEPPADGTFLRGSVGGNSWWWNSDGSVSVKYGVEKLFVEQGKGLEMESRIGQRNEWQQPMEVTLGIASDGAAGIQSWRWSDLALRLQTIEPGVRRNNDATDDGERRSPLLTFSMKNEGKSSLAFYNPGTDCGFVLSNQNRGKLPLVDDSCRDVVADATDMITLAPGQIHEWVLDMTQPRWHIQEQDHSGEIGLLEAWRSFRIGYVPPANLAALESDAVIWGSTVFSPAFFNSGMVD